MAIIDSVLVGNGRGKIGSVVLQGIKGQTIAKQLNPAPANPRTAGQTDSRNQMANTVLAWQFLSVFFAYRDWETDRKSTRLNSSHLKLSRMPSSA